MGRSVTKLNTVDRHTEIASLLGNSHDVKHTINYSFEICKTLRTCWPIQYGWLRSLNGVNRIVLVNMSVSNSSVPIDGVVVEFCDVAYGNFCIRYDWNSNANLGFLTTAGSKKRSPDYCDISRQQEMVIWPQKPYVLYTRISVSLSGNMSDITEIPRTSSTTLFSDKW